jgi:hypothetical protein
VFASETGAVVPLSHVVIMWWYEPINNEKWLVNKKRRK